MQYAGRLSPAAFWTRYTAREEQMRATAKVMPCYGLAAWSGLRWIGDWQWENGRLVTAGLAHSARNGDVPTVQVLTTVRDPREHVASLRLDEPGAPGDADAVRDRLREFETAVGEPAVTTVDAEPVQLTVWRDAKRWWAAGRHRGYGLVLEARQIAVEAISLVRVQDIEPYIVGRRAYLRKRRGEA